MYSEENYIWKKKVIVSYSLSILVFLIHCSSFANYESLPSWINSLSFFFQEVITPVGVPLFMIISGALFFRNYSSNQYISKIKRRIRSLVIPFVLWNSINMLFNIVSTLFFRQYYIGRIPFEFSLGNIIEGIFHYKYNGPFWFVFALIIFTVFAPLFDLILRKKIIGITVIIILWIASAYNIGIPTPFFFSKSCIVYFLVGSFIGKYFFYIFAQKKSKKVIVCSIIYIFLLWLYRFAIRLNYLPQLDILGIPILVLESICVWNCFDVICNIIKLRPFMYHSFWVFALHSNIGAVITKLIYLLLPKTPMFSIINFVGTLSITLIIIELISAIVKKTSLSTYNLLSGGR